MFLYRFREILTHTAFRYRVAVPIYCLMPDHLHMLWHGLATTSDQLVALRYFREQTGRSLQWVGYRWQKQAYDRVIREKEIDENELRTLVEYIARNPERVGIVAVDAFAEYAYTGCLIPGHPDLRLFQTDSWDRIWRAIGYDKRTDGFRRPDPRRA